MIQFYKEVRSLCNWCSCCPYTDMAEQIRRGDTDQTSGCFSLFNFDVTKILNDVIAQTITDTTKAEPLEVSVDKTTSETVADEADNLSSAVIQEKVTHNKWTDWNRDYELYNNEFWRFRCPYIQKKGLRLTLDREFIIPDDEKDILRLLDQISECYPEDCRYNKRDHCGIYTLNYLMKKGMAKIDFALIERGKDFGQLMSDMYFPYYDRKEDLRECGYSWSLINYYLTKYKITLYSNEEYEAMGKISQQPRFADTVEFKDALEEELCDENGVLKVTKAEYTRKAAVKYNIKSGYKQFWTRFDGIFKEKDGRVISFRSFLQSYRDQEQKNLNGCGGI